MVGREENLQEHRRAPEEISQRQVPGLEWSAVDDPARNEGGQKRKADHQAKEKMACQELSRGGRGGGAGTKGLCVLANRFQKKDGKHHEIRIIDVEHQPNDETQEQPLRQRAVFPRGIPIEQKESNHERRVRMGPRRIEVHVYGQGAGPPNRDCRQERPERPKIAASQTEGKQKCDETVESRAEGHGVAVRSGKAVRDNRRTKDPGKQDTSVREEQEWRPENGGADGEMVVEMAGRRSELGARQAGGIDMVRAKALIGRLVVMCEVQAMLDQRRAGVSVIANAIAAHPWIHEREGEQEKQEQKALVRARLNLGLGVQFT